MYSEYHVDYDGKLLMDENDEPIPSYICICAARSSSECGCGAWDVDIEWWEETYGSS